MYVGHDRVPRFYWDIAVLWPLATKLHKSDLTEHSYDLYHSEFTISY